MLVDAGLPARQKPVLAAREAGTAGDQVRRIAAEGLREVYLREPVSRMARRAARAYSAGDASGQFTAEIAARTAR